MSSSHRIICDAFQNGTFNMVQSSQYGATEKICDPEFLEQLEQISALFDDLGNFPYTVDDNDYRCLNSH